VNRTLPPSATSPSPPAAALSVPGAGNGEAEDTSFLVSLGLRVREARARRGMSRKSLAISAGVSERYLAQLESGETNASIVLLRRVGRALGVTLIDMLEAQQDAVEERLIRRLLDRLPAHRMEEVILRLMRDFGADDAVRRRRIALVGLRGAGKSTLGRRLAAETGMRFMELNTEIEAEAGMSLNEIFQLYGQPGFRRIERRCLEKLIEKDDRAIITVGGGVVSEEDTFNLLLENCYTVWVKATPEEHMARVVAQGDFRPMQGSAEAMEDMKRILAAREPLYRRADFTLDTTGQSPDDSLQKLREAVSV